jgi:hypothetical protein
LPTVHKMVDGVVLDFDGNGTLVGIDVQHANPKTDIQSVSLLLLPFHNLQRV